MQVLGRSYEAEDPINEVKGLARVSKIDGVSGGKLVNYIGNGSGNTLTFNKVNTSMGGLFKLTIVYATAENRKALVTINGTESRVLDFPSTGGWDGRHLDTIEVNVRLKQGDNTISFDNSKAYAPDIDQIAILPLSR